MKTSPVVRWMTSIALTAIELAAIGVLVRQAPTAIARALAVTIPCSGPIQACIDSAADGDNRPLGGKFDIGYDEWLGTIHRAYLPAVLKGH